MHDASVRVSLTGRQVIEVVKDVEVIKGRPLDHLDDLDSLDYLKMTATG